MFPTHFPRISVLFWISAITDPLFWHDVMRSVKKLPSIYRGIYEPSSSFRRTETKHTSFLAPYVRSVLFRVTVLAISAGTRKLK